jgi:menaquinone reductase, multiheme cytochrome c subunit
MPALFGKSADLLMKIGGLVVGLGALAGAAGYGYLSHPKVIDTGYSPEQPVPYSHKLHAGAMGLDCTYCHYTVTKAGFAAIPTTETCMNCHNKVKEKSEKLAPVRESYKTGMPVPWIQIHRLPDYVYFNHQIHVTSGVSCVSCHGRIDQMVEVRQVQPLNMGWCLECHRNPAPNLRPANLVTKLDWVPDRDPVEIGKEIIAAKNIHPPVNCSGCHR